MYHYDTKRKSKTEWDGSHSGLGAALEQQLRDGTREPISFAYRLLEKKRKNSTNELVLLALVWSCEHFMNYLLGKHFELLTDHKAIIFSPKTKRDKTIT